MLKTHTKILMLYAIIPLIGFLVDFATKQMVINQLCMQGKSVAIFPFFQLVCVLNTGVSFGFLAGVTHGKTILVVITIAILCGVYVMMNKEQNTLSKYCYSLIIAGAFGNIIDRILHGGVIDFLDFYYKTHHYPAFNVADSLIFLGVVGIIVAQFKEGKKEKKL